MGAVIEKVKKGSTADIEGQLRPGKNELNFTLSFHHPPRQYSDHSSSIKPNIVNNFPSSWNRRMLFLASFHSSDISKSQANKTQVVGERSEKKNPTGRLDDFR